MTNSRRILILGCGYVGWELARQLSDAGHFVFGLRRSMASDPNRRLPFTPLVGDLTRPETLETLPERFDWVINTASSSRGGPTEYREVYLKGTRCLLNRLRTQPPLAYVYTSSTSVYAQTDGSWVNELTATSSKTETGQILIETEQLLLDAFQAYGFPAQILRVAGIYGPGRGHLFQQFLRGEARLQGDGTRWINMIHRDDVARAVMAVLERGRPGEIYNVVDSEPVTQGEFLHWLAAETNRPIPSPKPLGDLSPGKRGVTHKRVSSAKLRAETGWKPSFPTFREGYAAELALLESGPSASPGGS